MVRDITPEMCIAFLDTKQGCSSKTISSYKNALEKILIACSQKFHTPEFYTEEVRKHKVENTYKTNSSRLYTNKQVEQIYNFKSDRQSGIKCMCFLGCRIHEIIDIRAKNVNLTKHIYILR